MALQAAIATMGRTAKITVESDDALAASVAAGQVTHHPSLPHKTLIAPAYGIHGDLEIRPISAMLELARGTALHHDPAVSAFARSWSTIRYLGIFAKDAGTGKLHLHGTALSYIGPNQRRVLSEDLGIGFGIAVAKRWCEARHHSIGPVTAVDVDMALYKGLVPKLQLNGSRQPDYLLTYSDPTNTGTKTFELLETKGTVSKSTASKQLSRAVTQLAGLTISGQSMTGIAVSTVSNAEGIHVMAVDPEERPITWEPQNEPLRRWRSEKGRPRSDDFRVDVSAEEFLATATNVEYASLAEFAGQHGAAERWLPKDPNRGAATDVEERRTTEAGTFIGTQYVIDTPRTSDRILLFQGVEEQIAHGLKAVDFTAVAEAQRDFAGSHPREVRDYAEASGRPGGALAFTSDGSMLEISIA